MRVSRSGFRLFRLFGVGVHLDYSWFIFFFLVVWTFSRSYFPRLGFSSGVATALGTGTALLLVFSVLFHEMSHAVTSNQLGFPIRRITLFVFGGVAHMHSEPEEPRTEFLVALAGPLSSLFLWIGFGVASALASSSRELVASLTMASHLNLALALFNLVPGFPLDGGRLLRAAVWWKTGSLRRATNVAARGGEIFAWILMLLGILTIFFDHRGFVMGIWYILIGVFVKNAAENSYRTVLMEELLDGIPVGEIMGRNPLSVQSGESLERVIDEVFLHHKFAEYPVVDESGHVLGIVHVDDIRDVPREERGARLVSEVMQTLPHARLPRTGTLALDALRWMATLTVQRLPVIDDSGRLAGIISQHDIDTTFQVRSGLES